MLNEERVKHMVKLASYESKNEKEIEISTYEKKDYVKVQAWAAFFWVTLSYALLLTLFIVLYLKSVVADMSVAQIMFLVIGLIVLYLVMVIQYIVLARRIARKKYMNARRNVKHFIRNLEMLEKMYEKEDV